MKILFFSYGDPRDKATWSNVPYCFSTSLEKLGHQIIKLNLKQYPQFDYLWNNYISRIILNKIFRTENLDFFHTKFCQILINKYIKTQIKNNPDADLCIFTTFSTYNKKSKIPSLLLGDWTLQYQIEINDRKPNWLEKEFIKIETSNLKKANYVYSLFPICADKINSKLGFNKVKWIGNAPLNILDQERFNNKEILIKTLNSRKIIFIGRNIYLKAANLLIDAIKYLNKKSLKKYELDIIGLTYKQLNLNENNDNITCYGYLNKNNIKENQTYYNLLRNAALFCNITPKWAGYSSTVEAMYYYTPILISPYDDFISQFGRNINFGEYFDDIDYIKLAIKIEEFFSLNKKDRVNKSQNAHESVKDFTWITYSRNLLNSLNENI